MATFDPEYFENDVDRLQLIEQLLEIGTALSGSYNLSELLDLILSKSREITCSDAGSVYLVDRRDEYPKLLFKTAQNDSRPNVSFREFAIPLTPTSLAGYVALTGESLNLPDAYYPPEGAPYELNRNFDRDIGYRTRSVLVIPMQNRNGEAIGVLQLLNRKRQSDLQLHPENVMEATQPYSAWEERIVRSLASQAGISIERNNLQEDIENLFETFVRTSVQSGILRSIRFDDRQLQEIRYAALLHDFGKIGVPEAILVKEKKLYPDRLDTVRTRFNLVRQTLHLNCAQAKYRYLVEHPQHLAEHPDSDCPHCQKLAELDRKLADSIEQLDEYWQILLTANEPRVLSEESLDKLNDLASYTYLDIDGRVKPLVTDDELAQLSILRGNLTPEERAAMEAHVTHSYEFLRQLPWTKTLSRIPEIAYGHHEKLDGSGYPRGLTAEEIPIQTQILTVADIYDALTAGDRPYKHGLGVKTALHILRQEAERYKINADILAVFEQRQLYDVLGHTLDSSVTLRTA